jgi:hypothetical protein
MKHGQGKFDNRIENLFERFNEPAIPADSIRKWLMQFEIEDWQAALKLLESIEYHSHPRLVRETRLLHEKLKEKLGNDGFDAAGLRDVDFSREFTCKSGDIISYIYRKSNIIPSIDFKTFDRLIIEAESSPEVHENRALVILDDYIGTGSQFLFQFIGRSSEDIKVISSYKKVYLCCIAMHEKAKEKGLLLKSGNIEEVIRLEEEQFPDVDFKLDEEMLIESLKKIDWGKVDVVFVDIDQSILSVDNMKLDQNQKEIIEKFLNKYQVENCEGSTCFLLGSHAFFYGAPNALPSILLPFFKRIEDFTIYPKEGFVGITSDIIVYDMDNERSAKITGKNKK